jgi:hypothetical protein
MISINIVNALTIYGKENYILKVNFAIRSKKKKLACESIS